MSLDQAAPSEEVQRPKELETLILRVVEATVAQLDISQPQRPFLTSRECADLLGVTPEHLCAMRSRSEGPPWSGEGKWIRYERRAAVRWLSELPRQASTFNAEQSKD